MPGPTPPVDLAATGGALSVSLTWTATSPGTVNLYRGTTAGGEGSTPAVTGITDTSYTDTGLSAHTTYYYYATTTLNSVESAASNEASATTTP
ncbi:MAG: hypothetical protein NVSMB52_07010 [Chloroflexota bacterium]